MQRIDVTHCTSANLTMLPHLSSNATMLYLDGNYFTNLTSVPFVQNRYVLYLFLNDSHIKYIQPAAFQGLDQLGILYLQNNLLRVIEHDTFLGVEDVQAILLNDNEIETIDDMAFFNMSQLEVLLLHNNKLHYIELRSLFEGNVLTLLTLTGNRLRCDCENGKPMQHWLIKKPHVIVNVYEIVCFHSVISDSALSDDMSVDNDSIIATPIISMDFSYCTTNNMTQGTFLDSSSTTPNLIIASIGCVIIIIVITVIVLYLCRDWIKWRLFQCGSFRFHHFKEQQGKMFDAYISCSNHGDDTHTALYELIQPLEQEIPPFRLCFQDRNWRCGADKVDCICNSVRYSRRIIILLSDHYVNDQWFQYEFQLCYVQALAELECNIIVILIQDILPQNMDKELLQYINTNGYLRMDDPMFWTKLKYTLPNVLRIGPPELDIDQAEQQTFV